MTWLANDVPGLVKPESRNAVQDYALVGNQFVENHIKGGNPVGDHDQQRVAEIIDIADFAADKKRQVDEDGVVEQLMT